MAWKQDLEKLKQQLGPETPSPVPKPLPKLAPKPTGPVALDDEDAVFLSAMGLKTASPRTAVPLASEGQAAPPGSSIPPTPESFQEAVKDLKGFKPLAKGMMERPPAPKPPPPSETLPAAPTLVAIPDPLPQAPLPKPASPDPIPPPQPLMPLRFQLAAGMAIEVDGTLDLRGHSLADALERLKDRLGDGVVLGWRSIQVTLGHDPALHEGLLALLASGEAPMVVRFAQAPVPMGGNQAWLLYFGPPSVQP